MGARSIPSFVRDDDRDAATVRASASASALFRARRRSRPTGGASSTRERDSVRELTRRLIRRYREPFALCN